MSVTDDLLGNNERHARAFDKGDLPLPMVKNLAVVARPACCARSANRRSGTYRTGARGGEPCKRG